MDYFFAPDLRDSTDRIHLSSEESHHLWRTRRKRIGEMITLVNGKGLEASARIVDFRNKHAICKIIDIRSLSPSPSQNIQVGLGLIRPNRMDWAVEKLSELGVGSITPLLCEYGDVRSFKKAHLQRIAISAIKQSHQAFLPRIKEPVSFANWMKNISENLHPIRFIAHLQDEATYLPENFSSVEEKPIFIAIGPEGGFSEEEIRLAKSHQFRCIRLDESILRSETAAVVAVTQLKLYLSG